MLRSRRLLFDTSVLIPLIRGEAYEALFRRSLRGGRARMSSVVMQELYAGAHSVADKKSLDGINRAFESRGYMVTPGHDDWIAAGVILARYQRLHGEVEPKDHIHDILIVLGAAKCRADLVTENAFDMERWKRMTRGTPRYFRILALRREDWRQ